MLMLSDVNVHPICIPASSWDVEGTKAKSALPSFLSLSDPAIRSKCCSSFPDTAEITPRGPLWSSHRGRALWRWNESGSSRLCLSSEVVAVPSRFTKKLNNDNTKYIHFVTFLVFCSHIDPCFCVYLFELMQRRFKTRATHTNSFPLHAELREPNTCLTKTPGAHFTVRQGKQSQPPEGLLWMTDTAMELLWCLDMKHIEMCYYKSMYSKIT